MIDTRERSPEEWAVLLDAAVLLEKLANEALRAENDRLRAQLAVEQERVASLLKDMKATEEHFDRLMNESL